MRSPKHRTTRKPKVRKEIDKKKIRSKSKSWRCSEIEVENLENINEKLRFNKCQRKRSASWRLMPKDSREVYRARRRRRDMKEEKDENTKPEGRRKERASRRRDNKKRSVTDSSLCSSCSACRSETTSSGMEYD